MKEIEEKAKAIVTENGRFPFDEYAKHRYSDLVQLATEQDRVARNEERERCIKLTQEWWCKNHCYDYNRCIHGLGKTRILREECGQKEEIREALEGKEADDETRI